jgi:hypothetical protein
MRKLNSLALIWRNVRRHPERIASEFVIDGRLLQDHIEDAVKQRMDLVSPIGWIKADAEREYARRLLLLCEPVLPSGRRELLLCPECADLACGCLSVEVGITEGRVSWSAFGFENNYDSASLTLFGIGAFVFKLEEYQGVLKGIAGS